MRKTHMAAMMTEPQLNAVTPRRDFTVAVFVTYRGRVLLLFHRRYGKWLPPGGHIRPGELPDDAAVREVEEETGLVVRLSGERALPLDVPRQLARPEGIQLEVIEPGHEHIDLIYFAEPVDGGAAHRSLPELRPNSEAAAIGWFALQELEKMDLTEEIRLWSRKALEKARRRR